MSAQTHNATPNDDWDFARSDLRSAQVPSREERTCYSEQPPPFKDAVIDRWHFKKVWARSALARALHQYAFSQDGHLNKAPTKHFTETLAESLPGNPEC
ncbi:hypothetical protein WJX79_003248 [Trebouxia sp. C0005]